MGKSLDDQMYKLIVQPLLESDISTVIVIDALDECRDEEYVSAILSVIGKWIHKIPKVKFFLTSRPEPRISATFRLSSMERVARMLVLDKEGQEEFLERDIRNFFKRELSKISQRRKLPAGWPDEAALNSLCERARRSSVYASATIKYLDYLSPQNRLSQLIASPEDTAYEGTTKLKRDITLDSFYLSILREGCGASRAEELVNVRAVLSAVVLAENPLSPSAIGPIFGLDTWRSIVPLLSAIQSLLIFHDDNLNRPVRPFHPSFHDFLTDPTRCHPKSGFYVFVPDHQIELLVKCIELMNLELEMNICSLQHAANNEDEATRKRAEERISPALEYTCKSWYKHLRALDPNLNNNQVSRITHTLRLFLEEKFLFWLEVLGLLGVVKDAIHALETTMKWLKKVCSVPWSHI